MKTLKIWSWWLAGVCLFGTGVDVQAVNLYLRSGSSTCTFSGSTTQTLQLKSGTNQTAIAFSAQTNLFSFYSAPLTNSVYIAAGKKISGTIGVQNNGSADFQFNASAVFYDYDPATGNQVQMVATTASGQATAGKNGKSGHVTLPTMRLGGAGHTLPAAHLLKTVITVTVNLSSGVNGALIYNAGSGNGKSLVQFPQDNSIIWPFGNFPTTPNASITTPASTQQNSTGNVASVLNAGVGATYFWSITNGTITAGQSTPQLTWTAGASGTAGLGITVVNGCFSSSGAAVVTLNVKTNQTITFNPVPTQTYGNSPIALVATASSGLPVTFSIVSGPATVSGSTLTITGAGTVVVNANQAGNAGYNPAVVEQSFNVNPAVLSVSGIAAIDKVYDSTATAVLDTSSAVLVGVVSGDSVALDFTFVAGYFADGNVGSGRTVQISGLDINGADAGNYTLVSPTTTASITAASLTITAVAESKTYDGTATSLATPTVAGLQGSDTVTGLVQTFDDANAGTGKTLNVSAYLVNDGNNGANYTVGTVSSSSGVINPVILTVTADNEVKMCGQPNPVLTASYSGFISGEDANVLTTPAALNTTATIGSAAGTYPITASSATAVNYTMNYVNGTLVVTQPFQLSCASVKVNGTDQFVVSWPTVIGQNYQLECSTNLTTPVWTQVGGPMPGSGTTIIVTNSMSGSPQCFFRVKSQ
jgi:hypothetical protein